MGSEKAMVNLIYCDKGESLGRPHWPGFFFGGGGLFIGAFKVVFGSCFPFCFGRHIRAAHSGRPPPPVAVDARLHGVACLTEFAIRG